VTIDIETIRRRTPGVREVVHFNNAGAGLMPDRVLDAQIRHLELEARIGGYEATDREAMRIDAVYDSVARLTGAGRDEIALAENATAAWDMAFYSLAFAPGDRILASQVEYAANYVAFLQVAERTGAVVEVIPSNGDGETCPDALAAMIDDRVRLISLTWIPTNGGLVNPAAEIGAVARAHGIPYLLDACQAAGQVPIDVEALGCDMLTATGRKFLRGPRGTGFLYMRRDLLRTAEPPTIDHFAAPWVAPDRYELRPDARRFETWENNYAARLGLGAAIDYALDIGIGAIWTRVRALGDGLRAALADIPGVRLHDIGRTRCGIVTLSIDGVDPQAAKAALGEQRINVSVSRPSSTLLDARARDLPPVIRASVHYYNDEDEIARFAAAIAALRRMKGTRP
jgi:selenocysteine lyase/cysteine desulfurase